MKSGGGSSLASAGGATVRAKPGTHFQGVPEVGRRDPSAIGGGGKEEGQTHLENQKSIWV